MYLTANSDGLVYYNDVLYACMKRVYGNEDLVGVPKYLVKQEAKVRKKLDQLKKNTASKKSLSRMTTASSSISNYGNSVNPISEILFLGMTMKAWLNYSIKVSEKMKAAQDNGIDYLSSDSDDYEDSRESEEPEEFSSSSSSSEEHIFKEAEAIEEAVSKNYGSDHEAGHRSPQSPQKSKTNPTESRLSQPSKDDYKFVVHKESPNPRDQEDPLPSADRSLHISKLARRTPSDLTSPPKRIGPDSVWERSWEKHNASDSKGEAGRIGTIKSLIDFGDTEKLSNISPVSRNDLGTFDPQENHSNLFGPSKIPIKDVLDSTPVAARALRKDPSPSTNRGQVAEMYEKAEKDQLSLPLSFSRMTRNKKGDNATPKSATSVKKSSPA